jgi:hypothetical protein
MKKQNRVGIKRILALLALALALIGMSAGVALGASYSDTEGHWGAAVIEKWSEYDVLHGYEDGSFAPDRDMSVAEFSTVLVNAFGYTEAGGTAISSAVPSWARGNVQKAVTAGVVASGETGLPLTREFAAKILANAFGVAPLSGATGFTDDGAVSAAYKPYVKAMEARGAFKGDTAGNFLPQKGFTRAELMQVLENAVTDIVRADKAATADKSLLVNTSGLELGAGTVKGDLIIGQGVGDGDVTLTDVKIDGRLIVYGGGENTIHIRGGSVIPAVVLNKTFGTPVRVVVDGAAKVESVSVVAESQAVAEGGIETIAVVPRTEVTAGGEITAVEPARWTTVEIASGATIANLVVTGEKIEVEVAAGATVKEATVASGSVSIEGAGKVTSVVVTSASTGGVEVTVSDAKIKNESGESVSVGAGKTVGAGASGTVPDTTLASDATPEAALPVGGGGGGGNPPAPPVDYSDAKAEYANYSISVSQLADITFVVVDTVSDDVAGVAVKAGSGAAKAAVRQSDGQYRVVLDGTYGLSEIGVTITKKQ